MAPKKKEVQKLSLGEFMQDSSYGSWADEVEDTYAASGTQPLPHSDRRGGYGSGYGQSERSSFAPRDSYPTQLPSRPPFTAHLGNLSYDATSESVTDFFTGCEVISVRIVEDREQQRPKGFGYVEFATLDGLKKALTLDGTPFEGRPIRVRIADPPKDRENRGDPARELDWSQRKGPLADVPRTNDRRTGPAEFSDRRGQREPTDDGKSRDFSDWTRRGPLSPRPEQAPQPPSRDGSRPPTDEPRSESFGRSNRRESPAAWGEGRQQDGSRPPRREFADRPERAPTAAERDMQWRNSMRPDAVAKSPGPSRSGSEAPPSPAPAAAVIAGPVGRPKLNLAKRTVSDVPDAISPAPVATDSKASPFGSARPIDTTARDREIEEKRRALLKEKKGIEDKAKERRQLSKESAATGIQKTAESARQPDRDGDMVEKANDEAENPVSSEKSATSADDEALQQQQDEPMPTSSDQKDSIRPHETAETKVSKEQREAVHPFKTRATESGNWRQVSGEQKGPRGAPTGPRRGGGGAQRAFRGDGPRPSRANGGVTAPAQTQSLTPVSAEPGVATTEEDGWTTVKKTNRNARPVASS